MINEEAVSSKCCSLLTAEIIWAPGKVALVFQSSENTHCGSWLFWSRTKNLMSLSDLGSSQSQKGIHCPGTLETLGGGGPLISRKVLACHRVPA